MAGTIEGARKRRVAQVGEIDAAEKWCTRCKAPHPRSAFGRDRTRHDGLAALCLASKRTGTPRRAPLHGPPAPRGRRGRRHPEATKALISRRTRERAHRGPQCHSYKDGKVSERRDGRRSIEYKRWRYDVFTRDSFTCQDCGDARGGNLHAHHRQPWADFPELRFDIDNGVTLCKPCHLDRHAKGDLDG